MKTHWYAFAWVLALALTFTLTSCDDDDENNDLIAVLEADSDYSTLVDAIETAGLTDLLADQTLNYTLFAPNNAAFTAFLNANGLSGLDDIPTSQLAEVLSYHLLGGAVTSGQLANGYYSTLAEYAPTEPLSLYVNVDGGVRLNGGANVTAADTDADNGVIHEIDAVLVPADVVDFALADPNFSTLVAALTRTDLTIDFVNVLQGAGPFTVFAPTNQAFADLLASNSDWNTLDDIPAATLEIVLQYHVVSGANVRSSDLTNGQTVTPLAGGTFSIDLSGATPAVQAGSSTANIIALDVQGSNGVIHAVDTVLLP